jgi:ubiquinone biosynthesis protein COQ9
MTDTPKKTTRKKAAPKEDAPQADVKDDAALREAVLLSALPHAAFDGFTDSVLDKAGKDAGISKSEVSRLFEGGPLALVEFYSAWADAQMEKTLGAMDIQAMKIRVRIAAAVKARFAALKPHKEAALVYQTVDAMWRAVGDTSTDFNFYTKRATLAGVYGATAVRWFTDDGEDEKATDEFLAARIENVMQFEKFKAKASEALSNLPAFANFLKPSK